MCGRFTLATPREDLAEELGIFVPDDYRPRYNIAPGQPVLIVLADDGGARAERARWGLVPPWAEDPAIGNRLINARAESAAQKPAFRHAFRRRRCLIPADGFFEWQKGPHGKIPFYIRHVGRRPFTFAGLWEEWRPDPESPPLRTCTILTTDANPLVRPIHARMPVILPPGERERWLDPDADPRTLAPLLQPYPRDDLEAYRVSTLVNSPRNDRPECIEPAGPP